MNQVPDHSTHPGAEFSSEATVRGTLERRNAEQGVSRERHARPLRRWSVAELIAGAVLRPPAGGVAH